MERGKSTEAICQREFGSEIGGAIFERTQAEKVNKPQRLRWSGRFLLQILLHGIEKVNVEVSEFLWKKAADPTWLAPMTLSKPFIYK